MIVPALLAAALLALPSPSPTARAAQRTEASRLQRGWSELERRTARFSESGIVRAAIAGGGIALDRAELFRAAVDALRDGRPGYFLLLYDPAGDLLAWAGEAPATLPTEDAEGAVWSAQSVLFYRSQFLAIPGGSRRARVVGGWTISRRRGAAFLMPSGGLAWHPGPGAAGWGTVTYRPQDEIGLVRARVRRVLSWLFLLAGTGALLLASRRKGSAVGGRIAAAACFAAGAIGIAGLLGPGARLEVSDYFQRPEEIIGFALFALAGARSLARGGTRPRWVAAGVLATAGFVLGAAGAESLPAVSAAFGLGLSALLLAGSGDARWPRSAMAAALAAAAVFGPLAMWRELRDARAFERARHAVRATPPERTIDRAEGAVPQALGEASRLFSGAPQQDLTDLAYVTWLRSGLAAAAPVSAVGLWREGRLVSRFSSGIPIEPVSHVTIGGLQVPVLRRSLPVRGSPSFSAGEAPTEIEIAVGAWPADRDLPAPYREYRDLLLAPQGGLPPPADSRAREDLSSRLLEGFTAGTAAAGAIGLIFAAGLLAAIAVGRVRMSLRPRTFRGRITLIFTVLVIIPFLAATVFIRQTVARRMERETLLHAQTALGTARTVLDDYLFAAGTSPGRRQLIDDDLLAWMAKVVGHDLSIYSDGRLFSTSRRELFASGLLPARLSGRSLARIFGSERRFVVESRRLSGSRFDQVEAVLASLPGRVSLSGPAVLSIPLLPEQRETEHAIARLSASLTAFTLAVFGLSLLLGARTAYNVTGPIGNLVQGTQAVARGEIPRLARPDDAELARLVDSFDQMSRTLARQREELARGERLQAWAEMARMIAHEVKNPLTPIRLSAEHVLTLWEKKDPAFGPVLERCVGNILRQTDALRDIVSEFSDYARLPRPEPRRVAVRPLLAEVVESFASSPNVAFTVDTPDMEIFADRRLIARALTNLVANAREALGPDGGRITLRARAEADRAFLRVEDDGRGVEDRDLSRLFEPYFSSKSGGTGLGLAIVRKIAQEHGGDARAENLRPRGFAVEIDVPREGR